MIQDMTRTKRKPARPAYNGPYTVRSGTVTLATCQTATLATIFALMLVEHESVHASAWAKDPEGRDYCLYAPPHNPSSTLSYLPLV